MTWGSNSTRGSAARRATSVRSASRGTVSDSTKLAALRTSPRGWLTWAAGTASMRACRRRNAASPGSIGALGCPALPVPVPGALLPALGAFFSVALFAGFFVSMRESKTSRRKRGERNLYAPANQRGARPYTPTPGLA